jgi:multidrug efflux pump subunit AcrB
MRVATPSLLMMDTPIAEREPRSTSEPRRDQDRQRSPITALAAGSARRWPITLGVWVVVIGIGLTAYFGGLAREGFPPVNLPIALVDGTYFVDDPEAVDADVTLPLSEAFGAIEGVAEVQAFAVDNTFAIVVEFEDTFSSPEGTAILEAKVARLALPPEAEVSVRSLDATKFLEVYDVLVSVAGPDGASAIELEAEAAKLQEFLAEDPSIVQADVRNLLTEGISPASGQTETRQTRFTRVALEGTDAYADAIAIGLVRNPDADLDILTFSDAVQTRIAESAGANVLAPGFTAEVTADFATDIRSQISGLTRNLLTGLVAVAIVSLLLIGWRASAITATFMATVMLAALSGLWFFGYSLNTITLFGLILTLGLLVDDAIVISESIDANRDEADDSLSVIRTAINRVGTASFAGTLTTVLVFGPMLFVGGVLGEFIRAIPTTVIITLMVSFFFSVIFIPAVARPFLLKGEGGTNPVIKATKKLAVAAGRLAEYPSSHGLKGVGVGVGLIAFAFAMIFASFSIAATLGFNIFPPGKDSNAISVTADFDAGTSIEQAQDLSRSIDSAVVEVLGDDLVRSQYIRGNERTVLTFVDLTPFGDRDTTAPEYVERLEAALADFEGARLTIGQNENGPPVEEFPFAAQISTSDDNVAEAEALAFELQSALTGAELPKASGEATQVTEAIVSTDGLVFRINGGRQVEVRASFSNDDLTNNLNAAEDLVNGLFPPDELTSRGFDADAISFDFGQESDNQDDFGGLIVALQIALFLVVALLVVQFRSIVQPLLIILAIPFSLFGVFGALSLTGNPISFFVFVGLIALIGVVVNNTILLIDAANQARRAGLRPGEAIGQAVTRRFRPLVATTLTTVVGLLPLALSDPFWEALSFTLIGGLISSTFLVLLTFPVFYLAIEKVRTPIRNAARRKLGWEEIA